MLSELSLPRSTLDAMTTIELSDDLAAALTAAAAARGTTIVALITEFLARDALPAGLDRFVGCMDSGDPEWAATDTKVLRKQASIRAT